MKKGIEEYLADVKKALTPKMLIFLAAGVVAFVIHPLLGLIFVGVAVNFLLSFYTSKGVLEREASEPSKKETDEDIDVNAEKEEHPWNL